MAFDRAEYEKGGHRDLKLRERLDRTLAGMRADRGDYEPHWQELERFCLSRSSGYLTGSSSGRTPGGRNRSRLNPKLLDGEAVRSAEILSSGMASGLTSPSTPWFTLTTEDPDLKEFQTVKEWLDDTKNRIYSFLARTAFYPSVKSGYRELGVFGTEACVMTSHWRHGGATYPLTAGEYWIALDDALVADTLYRRVDMTVKQAVEKFGDNVSTKVMEDYDKGNYANAVRIMHAIEPNMDRVPGRRDARNKAFRSIYWEETDEKDRILAIEGFDERPFWAPRWDTVGTETYGSSSPGMNALSDVKGLQAEKLRKHQAMDYLVRPALAGPTALTHTHANLMPGTITTLTADVDKFRAIWDVNPAAIPNISASIQETKQDVRSAFFVELFLAITMMPGVQPRNIEEIARRNEEKLTQLGPVVDRVQNEKLRVAVERAFNILASTRQLAPPPPELQGVDIKIEFVSVLAQAQRMIGVGAIERALSFTGNLLAAFPELKDKVDADQAADEYYERLGVPARMTRSDEAVAEIRAARAAQQQAQQMAQMAQPMRDVATAGKLLAETDAGNGESMLQRLGVGG